ncbi:MAG TPA: TraB/GumN family protein [Steroidobacteraceae bacterium]|nr:TraB/GumN family protein [Steroidobacteraceae bacterium]
MRGRVDLLVTITLLSLSLAAPFVLAAEDVAAAAAQDERSPPTERPSPDEAIDEVIVSGEQPGPPLWKVTNGDHVLFILGSLTPSPKNITWRSREVESVVARAKQIIAPQSVSTNIGFFRAMWLLPTVMRARKNPDGAELKDVLPPDLYARWQALKIRYIGNDRGIESWRPILAGFELYQKTLAKSGLTRENLVWPEVRKLARKHDVPIVDPDIKVDIHDPRGLIRDFTEMPREADLACFEATIDRLETDLEPMKQRAAAWAVGDIETLQRLQSPKQELTCIDAITSVPRLQDEFNKARERAYAEWNAIVDRALAQNDVTLAIVPITDLLRPTGRLSQLKARGYVVETPTGATL